MTSERNFVLQVEDNRLDADLLRRIFQLHNIPHDIITVTDGEKALEFLLGVDDRAEPPPRPRAILLDLKLPKLAGIEVLQRLRADESTKNIPVVVLSSSKNERDMKESYLHGANSYLCKPIGFAEYEKLMCLFADYWLNTNQVANHH